jgi:hypothetical protein
MKKRLPKTLTVLSLLFLVAVLVLWLRSYWRSDAVEFSRGGSRLRVVSEAGRLRLDNAPQLDAEWARHVASLERTLPPRHPAMVRLRGEAGQPAGTRPSLSNAAYFQYSVPAAVAALAAGLLPGALLIRLFVSRRVRAGLCARCGYDLRATPGRCPECGTDVATP